MTEVSDRYIRVSEGFGERVAGVAPGGWSLPTPCTDWTVRDLVAHVVGTQWRVLGTLGAVEAAAVDPEGDLRAQYREAVASITGALADDELASRTVGGMFGEQPFSSLVSRLVCTDTLVHTWDLARATGQDEQLDHDAVAQALAFLTPLDEAIRRPGGFAPKIPSAPGAGEQERLLNFCGRAL